MKSAAVIVCLMLLPAGATRAGALGDALGAGLTMIAHGEDAGFGRDVAPALSTDVSRPKAERAAAEIKRLSAEIDTVAQAFMAAPAATRIAQTRAVVARFDAETAKDGASRQFEGSGPYLSLMRQLLFVPSAAAGPQPADRILGIISAFEHAPRPEDSYYEYADPGDLKRGAIVTLHAGTAGAMVPGRTYLLKKCRHIPVLGWYCNTSRYAVRSLADGGSAAARLLLTVLVPLAPGADNAAFRGGRAENVVEGYTAAYLVLALPDLTLVYNLGIQSRPGALSMQGRLNREQQKESRELADTLKAALRLPQLPWEPGNAKAVTVAPGSGYTAAKTR